jgi:hypothetical protein
VSNGISAETKMAIMTYSLQPIRGICTPADSDTCNQNSLVFISFTALLLWDQRNIVLSNITQSMKATDVVTVNAVIQITVMVSQISLGKATYSFRCIGG